MTNKQSNADRAKGPLKVDLLLLIMGLVIVAIAGLIIHLLLAQIIPPQSAPSDEPSTLYLPLCFGGMGLFFALFGLYTVFTRKTFSIFGSKRRLYRDYLEGAYHLTGTGAVVAGLSMTAAGILFIIEVFACWPDVLEMMSAGDFDRFLPPSTRSPAGIIVAMSLMILGYIVGHIIQALDQ